MGHAPVRNGEPPELVGWGGFKGAPKEGIVELGYAIAPDRRGRGLATAAAEAMVAEAFDDPEVSAVIAHTLPERNASNRVLEKVGFHLDGEAAEDGERVWRFRMSRSPSGERETWRIAQRLPLTWVPAPPRPGPSAPAAEAA
jgi:[ribosomal protein S5]-alanine N-acetyltransferase